MTQISTPDWIAVGGGGRDLSPDIEVRNRNQTETKNKSI